MTKTTKERRGGETGNPPGLRIPEIHNDLTRREFIVGAGLIVLAPACGGGGGGASAGGRVIKHKYGETEISGTPGRVVSAGHRDHEHMLAMEVVPVGVRDWYMAGREQIFWPWTKDALGDTEPVVIGGFENVDFEKVAVLEPDLITSVYSGMTRDEYETLSEIAPTVPQSGEYIDYGMPWQEEARMIGMSLGRKERAEELIAKVENRFEEERSSHPGFKGKTAVMAQFGEPGQYYVLSPEDHKARFLTSLGFGIPDEIYEVVGDQSNALISSERLDLFERDVVVWLAGDEEGFPAVTELITAVKENEIYQSLDAVKEGRDVFLGLSSDAIAWSSALSLPFALDEAVPMLAAAVDGDPETTAETTTGTTG